MLKQRLITAVVLALFAIWALFKADDFLWKTLILLVAAVAAWEWGGFARVRNALSRLGYVAIVVLICLLGLQWMNSMALLCLSVIQLLLLLWVVPRYQRSQGQQGVDSAAWVLLIGVLFIVLFSVAMIGFREQFSAEALLLSLMIIWAVDTGAYFSGRRFGRRKLASSVSPGKTWEGVWGGVFLAWWVSLLGLLWLSPSLQWSMLMFAAVSALIAFLSVLGDLFESVLKRQVNLKDSGRILPGHGGVLDRIDSLLVAVPLFYLLWLYGSGSA